MRGKFLKIFLFSLLILGLVGCGNATKDNKTSKDKQGNTSNYIPVKYTYNDGVQEEEVTVTKPPQRAVPLSQFMTEMLLALGLENRMVGTALLDNEILTEYKKEYDKIPVLELSEGHGISKEVFVSLNPDFVGGWDVSITEQSTGSAKELIENNIAPFVPKSISGDATIETVYEDFQLLGKIFGVQEKANEVINIMKQQIQSVQDELKTVGVPPKVLVYDSGTKEAMVVGSGLANELVTLAGGENIYKNSKKAYERVSFESIIKANPDVIIVVDYFASGDASDKIKFLKEHPGLKNVNAIKNNRFGTVGLADLSPGVRNAKVIREMHDVFYK